MCGLWSEVYGPVNNINVMSSRSFNLLTLFLGRLSSLGGYCLYLCIYFRQLLTPGGFLVPVLRRFVCCNLLQFLFVRASVVWCVAFGRRFTAQWTILTSCQAGHLTYSHFSWVGLVLLVVIACTCAYTFASYWHCPSWIRERRTLAAEMILISLRKSYTAGIQTCDPWNCRQMRLRLRCGARFRMWCFVNGYFSSPLRALV